MTDQQRLFCDEYLKCFNGTKAAIAAGYSEQSARSKASQLLAQEDIEKYIEARKEQASTMALVDLAWVMQRAKDISDRCMQVEPVMIFDGESWVESGEYKFDSSGANKSTEMLGKMIGAFEKDNSQKKQELTIPPVVNVYNTTPPLASSEEEVDK